MQLAQLREIPDDALYPTEPALTDGQGVAGHEWTKVRYFSGGRRYGVLLLRPVLHDEVRMLADRLGLPVQHVSRHEVAQSVITGDGIEPWTTVLPSVAA